MKFTLSKFTNQNIIITIVIIVVIIAISIISVLSTGKIETFDPVPSLSVPQFQYDADITFLNKLAANGDVTLGSSPNSNVTVNGEIAMAGNTSLTGNVIVNGTLQIPSLDKITDSTKTQLKQLILNNVNGNIANMPNILQMKNDISNLQQTPNSGLPIGTIIAWKPSDNISKYAFDTFQVDIKGNDSNGNNVLPAGWGICNGMPVGGVLKTPDLIGSFLLGSNIAGNIFGSNTAGCTTSSTINGNCTVLLKAANLPNHSHILPIDYIGRNGAVPACQKAGLNGGGGCFSTSNINIAGGNSPIMAYTGIMGSVSDTKTMGNIKSSPYIFDDIDQEAVISYNNRTKNVNNVMPQPLDIMPPTYSVIYIIKVA